MAKMVRGNGISNLDVEKFFENETNDDSKKNFMGIYSSNYITKYINFYEIIKEKKCKYPFAIFNMERNNNQGCTGGVFLISIQKKAFCYLIVLVLQVLKNSL